MKLDKLKNKRILILGFGREGQDTFRFLRKLFPNKVLGIADEKKFPISNFQFPKAKWYLGKDYLKVLKNYDIIIKSPGIPFKILPKRVLKKITSQTEIFFENCLGKIIGVAGTKGKSTTAFFIYQTLKQKGIKVYLIGNIGKPALSFLLKKNKENNIYIYELSSFQLMNLKKSPHISVLLNSYPDHLDWHKDFNEYVQTNANMACYQTEKDFLIYNSQDKLIREIAKKSKAKKITIGRRDKSLLSPSLRSGKVKYYDLNIEATKAVAKIFKVKPIKKYTFLPHRLEFIGNFKNIKFYNDSLSVIPETTIKALDFLGDKVQTLILGGFDRGLCFKKMAKRILKSKIKTLILFPTTGKQILQEIKKIKIKNKPQYFFIDRAKKTKFYSSPSLRCNGVQYMKDAIKLAYQHTQKEKICLLSPASASFGIFKDYKERGDLFKRYVKKFNKEKKR